MHTCEQKTYWRLSLLPTSALVISTLLFLPARLPAQQRGTVDPAAANIAPLTTKEKFNIRVIQTISIRSLIGAAVGAGIAQGTNTPSEWGGGGEGYGKRFASTFGGSASRAVFAFGMETALHEDPRYFPSLDKGFKSRMKSVIKQTFVTHTDSGSEHFAYSRFGSAIGAGFLVNSWQPSSNNTAGDAFERAAITIGVDAGLNLLQEFVPRTRPKSIRRVRP